MAARVKKTVGRPLDLIMKKHQKEKLKHLTTDGSSRVKKIVGISVAKNKYWGEGCKGRQFRPVFTPWQSP